MQKSYQTSSTRACQPLIPIQPLTIPPQYIALEVFASLLPDLHALTYSTYTTTPALQTRYAPPLPRSTTASHLQALDPAVTDTLTTYALPRTPSSSDSAPEDLLGPVLNTYLSAITAAPLPPSQTKALAQGCETCLRLHVPLTYHHLIPRAVHEKAVKRGWHARGELGSVAWLCRACHSFVHGKWGHEELARELFTVERLLAREEVRGFAAWVGRVRWKSR